MTAVEVIAKLTPAERKRLAELEGVIASGFDRFVEVGLAFRTIRDEGLYRDHTPPTFEAYFRDRWDLAPATAYRYIDVAHIVEAISPIGETPASEAVVRELAPVLRHKQGRARVAEAWAKVIEQHEGDGPITARETLRVLLREGYRKSTHVGGGGRPNLYVLLGQVGDKLRAADKRLAYFLDRDLARVTPPLSEATRARARDYARICEAMAALFQRVADGELPEVIE